MTDDDQPWFWRLAVFVWRLGLQLIHVGIVIGVLTSLQGRVEHLIADIGGLLYATIRTIGVSGGHVARLQLLTFSRELDQLKAAVIPDFQQKSWDAIENENLAFRRSLYPGNFTQYGVAAIYIVCLLDILATVTKH